MSDLGDFYILLSPKDEQVGILSHCTEQLQGIDLAILRTQRQVELVREYRTRLIADVVTGKLDVRGVQVQEGRTSESAPCLEGEDGFEDINERGSY